MLAFPCWAQPPAAQSAAAPKPAAQAQPAAPPPPIVSPEVHPDRTVTFRFRDRPQVQIIEGDVLKTDLHALVPEEETAYVIGNLPYYITSDILQKLFAAGSAGHVSRAVLMMQREVADRVAAAPGVRDYGLLSATAQMNARVDHLFTLPPSAFSRTSAAFCSS